MTARVLLAAAISACIAGAQPRYFEALERAIARVDRSSLKLQEKPEAHHYPGVLLVAATLYAKTHPENRRAGDPAMLELALAAGDVLAAESERGIFPRRDNYHRDVYMWLEAYRNLESRLGDERRARWRNELTKLIHGLAKDAAEREHRPAFTSPFGVPVNHTALFSATVHLAGLVFHNREWEELGARIMHRYAAEEQAPDGYWGEHSRNGPTTGYNYLTLSAVALYWEHSRDPAALAALRRATDLHKNFTYPDGQPVMITDDRRRHSYVSPWGNFGFSHFPDGRAYAALLLSRMDPAVIPFEHAGRLAQDALYYHEGPVAPIPQQTERYAYRMSVPAGIRKSGPWISTLSGIVATQNAASRFYLDRQSALEIYHEKYGVIVSGANSKRQPELATFRETVRGHLNHMPLDSRLRMDEAGDRLSLAYNTFTADVETGPPAGGALPFRFAVHNKGKLDGALTLQLVLAPGQTVEPGSGARFTTDKKRISLDPGQSIRHRGWRLSWKGAARLEWPVYPYYPYDDDFEKELEHAVGALTFKLADSAVLEFRLEDAGT